jgi:hypothetical protein
MSNIARKVFAGTGFAPYGFGEKIRQNPLIPSSRPNIIEKNVSG